MGYVYFLDSAKLQNNFRQKSEVSYSLWCHIEKLYQNLNLPLTLLKPLEGIFSGTDIVSEGLAVVMGLQHSES